MDVFNATALYDDEGYDSMSLDRYRNLFFIRALQHERRVHESARFLEIGTGADAKLTRYILNLDYPVDRCVVEDPPLVTAVEMNPLSFDKAVAKLGRCARLDMRLGEATTVVGRHESFDCVVAEIIGMIASCEGQCRILRHLPASTDRFVPQTFATLLYAYSGSACTTTQLHRCRSRRFGRAFQKKNVATDVHLVLEDWDALRVHQGGYSDEQVFRSQMDVTNACALIACVEMTYEDLSCSSAPWAPRARRADNWDVVILPLPRRVSGRLCLYSSTRVADAVPKYALDLSLNGEPLHSLRFDLASLLIAPRVS